MTWRAEQIRYLLPVAKTYQQAARMVNEGVGWFLVDVLAWGWKKEPYRARISEIEPFDPRAAAAYRIFAPTTYDVCCAISELAERHRAMGHRLIEIRAEAYGRPLNEEKVMSFLRMVVEVPEGEDV